MLKKKARLTAEDIEILSKPGTSKSVFGTLLSLRVAPAPQQEKGVRLSVTVSKKIAPRAVDRTRLRRRVYAAAEKPLANTKVAAHILVLPKKECLTVPYEALGRELSALFAKARLSS